MKTIFIFTLLLIGNLGHSKELITKTTMIVSKSSESCLDVNRRLAHKVDDLKKTLDLINIKLGNCEEINMDNDPFDGVDNNDIEFIQSAEVTYSLKSILGNF